MNAQYPTPEELKKAVAKLQAGRIVLADTAERLNAAFSKASNEFKALSVAMKASQTLTPLPRPKYLEFRR